MNAKHIYQDYLRFTFHFIFVVMSEVFLPVVVVVVSTMAQDQGLVPNVVLTGGRTGAWEENEDMQLKAAKQAPGDKTWDEIAEQVQGRTKRQCMSRWQTLLLQEGREY
jgi:hypothetical protein